MSKRIAGADRPLLALESTGRGDPLVLLHGLATTRAIWAPVVPMLSRDRRVVCVDLPGFGDSAPTGTGFELETVAERIARGFSARGVRGPLDLVGHSLGAGVALTLAAIRPRTVRRLILVAPAGLRAIPSPATRVVAAAAGPLLAVRRMLVPLAGVGWGRRILLGFAAADGARISPTNARMMIAASASAKQTAAALQTIAASDLRPLLRRVEAAIGVIWGQADRTVPARTADVIRRARPDAEFVVLERAGHVPMIERPEAFAMALTGLLARLSKHLTSP